MKKVFISGFVAMSLVMFSFANPTNTGTNTGTTEQNAQAELIAGNGNNNCTPNVDNYDYNFTFPGFPFPVNLVCVDEPLYLTEINIHAWGKAVRSASCHVNDKGTQEESTYLQGAESGDIYHLSVTSTYHYNYNFTFEGGIFMQQGAYVSRGIVAGEITNQTTGEVIPVTISSRFVINANGTPTVDLWELSCE
jgi:hypothetical protein